ncbi:universal stress protein [Paracidovorax wautersii]|uniref:Nucleotide-binding universal stress UspA family protein n=1 Tax=Paracidovorax wautersii TaxID=1177982 RepID=A0ABU1IDY2_9BURK|nr:universal stress protein [Paracidovorax wautersii]MDR6215429.1 nucleotide-binding universal stress UspA family protein [Paracidovorax wautersii]
MNHTVYACIDGLAATPAVVDAAAWAARQLTAPLALLHALERPAPMPAVGDYGGIIGMGAQDMLLQQLSDLDEERQQVAVQAARHMLENAQRRVAPDSVPSLQLLLRQGELLDTLLELEGTARLVTMGEHHRAAGPRKLHLDHRVESVIRTMQRPVLVVTTDQFNAPTEFVVAYDGSPTARRAVEAVARSPLLRGMPGLLVTAGQPTDAAMLALEEARALLAAAGFSVGTQVVPGEPEEALPALLQARGQPLLVLGAYGHSRIRQFIVGSTTTTLLRLCTAPVLVLR